MTTTPPPPPPPPDEPRRKRKWDEGPSDLAGAQPAPAEGDGAAAAAAAAAAQAAAHLSRTLGGGERGGGGEHWREFEINDHPGRRFAMMSANIRAVEQRSGVVIVSKGRYYAPGERRDALPGGGGGDEHRPLFLKIVGPSADALAGAVRHLEDVMAPRAQDPARPDRVWADMDAASAPAFDVVARLRGPARQYLAYIERESGARVDVAGRGVVPHARENLHLAVRGDPAAVAKARPLCQSLCRAVRPVFDAYRAQHYPDAAAAAAAAGGPGVAAGGQHYGNGRAAAAPRLAAAGGFGGGGGPPAHAAYGPPPGGGSTPEWMSGRRA